MKTALRNTDDHGVLYQSLLFVCPGCINVYPGSTGLHRLPVNSAEKSPSWSWDGNLELPTLSPSILTTYWICAYGIDTCYETSPCENCSVDSTKTRKVCHSFLKAGVFEFLSDCTHSLAGQHIPLPDLPTWVERKE